MIGLLKTPSSKRKFLVFIGDAVIMAATISFLVFLHAFLQRYGILKNIARPLKPYALCICPFVHVLMCYIFEMYDTRRHGKLRTFVSMLTVSFLSFCILFGLAKVVRINQTTMVYIFVFFIASALLLYYWRLICRRVLLISRKLIKQKILFVGSDSITKEILQAVKSRDYNVLGLLTESDSKLPDKRGKLRSIGSWNDLQRIVHKKKPAIIITALNVNLPLPVVKSIYRYKLRGLKTYDSAYFYEIITGKVAIKHYLKSDRIPYFNLDPFSKPTVRRVKRVIDLLGALSIFILISPLFVVLMILVKVTSRGTMFFTQERVGFQEKPFKILKFRTMIHNAEKETGPTWACKNDTRITLIGWFLRKLRLDELPQLLNIIKGDMSFVGPRPFRRHFVEMFEKDVPFYSLKFSIKPGLTGWAQVNHNYSDDKQTLVDNIERLQYDLYYLKHASIFLDIFIILKTFQTIVRRPAY